MSGDSEIDSLKAEIRVLKAELDDIREGFDRLRIKAELLKADNDRLRTTVAELYRRLIEAKPDEGNDETYIRLAQRLS